MKRLLKIILGLLFPRQFIVLRQKSAEAVAITFDDGPHPQNTKRLLEILKKEGARATFFVSGAEAEKYPELVKAVAEDGHEIGNHSFSHKKIKEIGWPRYRQEIEKTARIIRNLSGKDVALFRPPYGEITWNSLRFILNSGLICVGWTLDSDDSYLKDKELLVNNFGNKSIRDGDIILFHEDYSTTIEAMPEIIKNIQKRGLKLVTVSDLLKR